MTPARILIVDDSEADAELALQALDEGGFGADVVVVRDGKEALDYLLREGTHAGRTTLNPSLVLLDVKMPRIDGFQVLERIRQHDELKVVPVVMLTSSQEVRDVSRAYASGANAYVVKLLSFKAFAESMRAVGEFWSAVNRAPPGSVTFTTVGVT